MPHYLTWVVIISCQRWPDCSTAPRDQPIELQTTADPLCYRTQGSVPDQDWAPSDEKYDSRVIMILDTDSAPYLLATTRCTFLPDLGSRMARSPMRISESAIRATQEELSKLPRCAVGNHVGNASLTVIASSSEVLEARYEISPDWESPFEAEGRVDLTELKRHFNGALQTYEIWPWRRYRLIPIEPQLSASCPEWLFPLPQAGEVHTTLRITPPTKICSWREQTYAIQSVPWLSCGHKGE